MKQEGADWSNASSYSSEDAMMSEPYRICRLKRDLLLLPLYWLLGLDLSMAGMLITVRPGMLLTGDMLLTGYTGDVIRRGYHGGYNE